MRYTVFIGATLALLNLVSAALSPKDIQDGIASLTGELKQTGGNTGADGVAGGGGSAGDEGRNLAKEGKDVLNDPTKGVPGQ